MCRFAGQRGSAFSAGFPGSGPRGLDGRYPDHMSSRDLIAQGIGERPRRVGDRPRRVPLSHRRTLVAHHTRLQRVPGVDGIRLHLADDLDPVWRATETAFGISGAPIPFWAFAWAGGLALARFVLEHPEEVRERRVLDFGTGSGLVAIAAALMGASSVAAADIDGIAEAAVALNARANGVRIAFVRRDLLDDEPPDVDLLLAGDTWYEGPLAERVLPWLRAVARRGTRVLVGDPGRRYLPADGLEPLASYVVRTTTRLEDRDVLLARVFTLRPEG
jgi:predicted nicotinamide N-methyase